MTTYLQGLDAVVRSVDAEVPTVPFEQLQAQMTRLAEDQGSTVVVWCQPGAGSTVLVHVLDVRGETALVRTLELGDEPPLLLHRTVAAVVRTVVESGMLERAAQAEREGGTEGGTEAVAEPTPTAEVETEAVAEPTPTGPSVGLALAAGYSLRIGQQPTPVEHGLSVRLWLSVVNWLALSIGGRFGVPADLEAGVEGSVWRAALTAGVGLGRRLGPVAFGVLAGVDLEWLRGAADAGVPEQELRALELGGSLDAFLFVSLWRGLDLTVSAGVKLSPKRRVFLYQDAPVAATNHGEGTVELGLRWRFM